MQLFAQFAVGMCLERESFGDGENFEEVGELVDAGPFFEKSWTKELIWVGGENRLQRSRDGRYRSKGGSEEVRRRIRVGADP